MSIEVEVAKTYYTNYNPEKDPTHAWNEQYINLVRIWGDCSRGHILCSCTHWDEHNKVTSPDNSNINHRQLGIAAIDKALEKEELLNEALTSTSPLIRERARILYVRRFGSKT